MAATFSIKRVTALPASPAPNVLYIVDSPDPNVFNIHLSSTDGTRVERGFGHEDVQGALASLKNAPGGFATLDENGIVPASALPSWVTKINNRSGMVTLSKVDVGLGNVDNTADAAKPVSTAQAAAIAQAEINAKAASTPISHQGAGASAHANASVSSAGFMSTADKAKLDSITGTNTGDETVTSIKSKLGISVLSGSNTGDQTDITGNAGTATKLQTARMINGVSFDGSANITINAADSIARVASSEKGAVNGVATLDATGKVPSTQLPSYVDDVVESANLAAFPATGDAGKIYVALDTNKTYRWSGTAYVYITSGAVDSVNGKTGIVVLAKSDLGLGNVDNTSDVNKPISTATQNALDLKIPWSASGAPNGVASLGADSKLLYDQLPLKSLMATVPAMSASSIIPFDDTTPLITEGTQIASLSFGPSSSSGKLQISGDFMVDCGNNNRNLIITCFRDNTCIGSLALNFVTAGRPQIFTFSFYDPDFGTFFGSNITYSLRFGVNSNATWYINRMAAPVMNGTMALNRAVKFEELN